METREPRNETIAERLSRSQAFRNMLEPLENKASRLNDEKIRRLYLQAASQQWFAPDKLDFDRETNIDPELKRAIVRLTTVFYTLEKMGLSTITRMMPKALSKMKSDDAAFYLATQTFDESRHVFALSEYLRKLGTPPKYDWKLEPLNRAANWGPVQVENWLFSTLFSENFASAFLRRMKSFDEEPLLRDICRNLLMDESRHLHFLHIVLPDILDRMSAFSRAYVKMSQFFIMKFTVLISKTVINEGQLLGLDRKIFLEEVFEHIERAYEGFGVTRDFLYFPSLRSVH